MCEYVDLSEFKRKFHTFLNIISTNAHLSTGVRLSAWNGRGIPHPLNSGSIQSKEEWNPWIVIYLSQAVTISAISIINRRDCCGDRLKNLVIRAGTSIANKGNDPVVGHFDGPGWTGGVHRIVWTSPTEASGFTIQMAGTGIVHINGVKIDTKDYGKNLVNYSAWH